MTDMASVIPVHAKPQSGIAKAVSTWIAKRRVYQTTFNELAALSDRDLADIGISRSMIKGLAQEAVEAAKL